MQEQIDEDEKSDRMESDIEEMLLEPRFKYSRILNNVPGILRKDMATCMAIHDKFAALGSRSGNVYIIDHFGSLHPESTARHHRCPVTKISIDPTGSYFVSCSQDARISVAGITSFEFAQIIDLKIAARSVAIDPDFTKRGSGHMFVSGERNLLLHHRTFFGNYREKILYEGMDCDGIITQISWQGCCILKILFYFRNANQLIALVQPTHEKQSTFAIKVRPSHCWINNETLAIGWYDTVSICMIIGSSDSQVVSSIEKKEVEVHYAWKFDMYIADISFTLSDDKSCFWKEITVFGMKKAAVENNECEMVLALLEPEDSSTFSLTTEDRIEMCTCDQGNLTLFHMSSVPHENVYFLLGCQEFIEAQPCSADDRVRWYLENDLLRDAMQYANEHKAQLEHLDPVDIGKRYLNSLTKQKRFAEAAANLKAVCGRQKDLWEYYVNEFEQNNVVLQLAKYLPVRDPQLEPECYQCVLIAALHNHPVLFYNLIKVWNPDLFRVGAITDMAMKRIVHDNVNPLSENDAVAIYRSLARLYLYERKYDKALMLYIMLNDKTVFQVIEKYHLFDLVKNDLTKLMAIDTNLTIRLLIENAGSLPTKTILTQLAMYPKLQLAYLNTLFERNEGEEFIDFAIKLYAENEPQLLLPFLRKTAIYDIAKAIDICEKKQYINEMVYLLGRSGNRMKALDLLVNKLGRIDSAIDFCRENDDSDLWNSLVDAAVKRPDHIMELLNTAGKYVNPLNIIEKIPEQMNIPGLRNLLVTILRDYELLVQMQRGSLQVTEADSNHLFAKYLSNRKCSTFIGLEQCCIVCRIAVLLEREKSTDCRHANCDIIVYDCGHSAHIRCIYVPHSDGQTVMESRCPMCYGLHLYGKR
ncbi:Vacuolar assembly protein VPS41 homolog, putative [Brugia malayi]|uniref:Vacuolar assembly protein VPS41 homolog, putative n=1 Tax=Brugia malayi TaxID=6279 RepID=A0A4E9FT40_BRUMA|nr:Vacuolar assembly protein VPS41 homolog, putative [Brugia malayi]VIO99680.1 Vacuolar assembly protein VPS41 homolog, putative [Brugia malayi]